MRGFSSRGDNFMPWGSAGSDQPHAFGENRWWPPTRLPVRGPSPRVWGERHPQTKLALTFLLLTFVRTGELRGAEWKEVNFEKSEWRIPPERMKMREVHIVPLSTQAVAVLRELEKLTGERAFLFPNQHKPAGCMSENPILYALYRMDYHSRATGHGFRSTASTVLNEHGFKPDVIERQLDHCERNQVRAAYNHAQYLPDRREMMQWWADHLDSLTP